jgi:hypothetical protein
VVQVVMVAQHSDIISGEMSVEMNKLWYLLINRSFFKGNFRNKKKTTTLRWLQHVSRFSW